MQVCTHTHTPVLSQTAHNSLHLEGEKRWSYTWCFALWCTARLLVFLNQWLQIGHCTTSGCGSLHLWRFMSPVLLNCLPQTPHTIGNCHSTTGPLVADSSSLHLCTAIAPWSWIGLDLSTVHLWCALSHSLRKLLLHTWPITFFSGWLGGFYSLATNRSPHISLQNLIIPPTTYTHTHARTHAHTHTNGNT